MDKANKKLFFHFDCRYFLGDRPCLYHKQFAKLCSNCSYYEKIGRKVLLIKLGATGDVLRTTPIVKALKVEHKDMHINWLVSEESSDILLNNPFVDTAIVYTPEIVLFLLRQKFDLVINLDFVFTSCALASLIPAEEKMGFGLNEEGQIICFNPQAQYLYSMSMLDNIKKANTRSYQDIMYDIVGVRSRIHEMVLEFSADELALVKQFIQKNNLGSAAFIVGLHTGVGERWPAKQWTLDAFSDLISRLSEELKVAILLFGGERERERNKKLKDKFGGILIDTGSGNTLRQFAALLGICHLVVSCDTLAMHIAIALKKKTVVLFGPTSSAEIDLYGRGDKISSSMDCLCCYKTHCKKSPSCMEQIDADTVYAAVQKYYLAHKKKRQKNAALSRIPSF